MKVCRITNSPLKPSAWFECEESRSENAIYVCRCDADSVNMWRSVLQNESHVFVYETEILVEPSTTVIVGNNRSVIRGKKVDCFPEDCNEAILMIDDIISFERLY